jgi:hypothetical protein
MTSPPQTATDPQAPRQPASGIRYPGDSGPRDLRIDFLRGVVMFVLVVAHFELVSFFSILTWERVGLVSGAEGFVILSGIVLGIVHRQGIERHGMQASAGKLLDRAAQLYRVNLFVIFSIGVLAMLPFLDASAVTTFVERGSGQVFGLYPSPEDPPTVWLAKAMTLKIGPHQFQILGLYVFLLLAAPLALFAFRHGRTALVLGISWWLYFENQVDLDMPTGAQFEYAFPLLSWQVLFFHGLAVGYHRAKIAQFAASPAGKLVFALAWAVFLAGLFLAQNTTNAFLPWYTKMRLIPAETFDHVRHLYFDKNLLRLGRIVSYAAVLVVFYWALTRFWRPLDRAFGWFFIPIGQATLYVFVVHVYLILIVTQFLSFGFESGYLVLNTLVHTLVLAVIWLMVRRQVLFRWIPR